MFDTASNRARSVSRPAWGDAHTLAVVIATAVAVGVKSPVVLASVALCSFAILLVQYRGRWTPNGAFGAANLLTSVRLTMSLALLAAHGLLSNPALAGVALSILILDGVDGWLARRLGLSSDFGARYDVETDGLFVLAMAMVLLARGITGPWVLIAGLWRYFYVLARLIVPSPIEAPRTLFGRVSYASLLSSFVLALLVPGTWGAAVAGLGTVLVSISFVRSFYQCYFPAPPNRA